MKFRYFKNVIPAAVVSLLVAGGVSSCTKDLDQSIQDPQTNTQFNATGLLAKIYGNLTLTGTIGGSGNADMSQFDEGNSSMYRRIFEANELCSDECIWTWQGDAGIPELTNISWNSSHGYNELTYYRLMYNITLCNFYLDQTEGTEDAQMLQNRAEVRFIRALHYYYFIDLYGCAPYKLHYNDELPEYISRADCFNFVVGELKAINGENAESKEVLLESANSDANYGRADRVAANMLLARMYLNAQVYTGTPQWATAQAYAQKVIDSSYKLCTESKNGFSAYQQLFMGDNGENANARQEIIFPIRCDGATSRSYGGSVYTIASTTGNGTPDQGIAKSQWTCNRSREALVKKFFSSLNDVPLTCDVDAVMKAAGDDRARFFSGWSVNDKGEKGNERTTSTEEKTTFSAGLGIMKWTNYYCDPNNGAPKDVSYSDTDVPLFRVAEAYLTLAEATFRLEGPSAKVITLINTLRSRAHAAPFDDVTELDICDEWCREFYFEGRRRSDLIRFGYFTSGDYLWDWKGGVYTGAGVSDIYNLYPIPANEINSNPNMCQNKGY